MKIVCCYAAGKLRKETYDRLEPLGAHFIQVDGEFGYWKALMEQFEAGETFLNVEHDIVPPLEGIADVESCRNSFCYIPYTYLKEAHWWQVWHNFCDKGTRGDIRGACQELTDAIWAIHCQGLGCVKFGEKLLRERREYFRNIPKTPWIVLDGAIYNSLGYMEVCKHNYHAKHVEHIDWPMRDQTSAERENWTLVEPSYAPR